MQSCCWRYLTHQYTTDPVHRSHDRASVVRWSWSKEYRKCFSVCSILPLVEGQFLRMSEIWTWTQRCYFLMPARLDGLCSSSYPEKLKYVFLPLRYWQVNIRRTLDDRPCSVGVRKQALKTDRPRFTLPVLCHLFIVHLGTWINLQSSFLLCRMRII